MQRVEIRLILELGRESLQGLGSIVLPAIEAPIYEALNATSQGVEQSSDDEGGDDDGELGLLLLTSECAEDRLGHSYAAEVDQSQHSRERAVDQRAVYEEIYVVESVAQNRHAHRDRHAYDTNLHNYVSDPFEP